MARYTPSSLYVNVGFGWRESIVPSPSKSQAYLMRRPSGSATVLVNCTVSGGAPSTWLAVTFTVGV